MIQELLPCPWCNGIPEYVDATQVLGVHHLFHRCRVMGHLSIQRSNKDDLFPIWNTRTVDLCAHDKPLPNVQALKHWQEIDDAIGSLQENWETLPFRYFAKKHVDGFVEEMNNARYLLESGATTQ